MSESTAVDLRALIAHYRARIRLVEPLVQQLATWKQDLKTLEEAEAIATMTRQDPVDLDQVVDELALTGFDATGVRATLNPPLPAPAANGRGRPPTALDRCVALLEAAGRALPLNALLERLAAQGYHYTQEGLRSQLSRAVREGDPRLTHPTRQTWGLRAWEVAPPPPRFGSDRKPEPMRAIAERLLAQHGAPLTGQEVHRGVLRSGRQVPYDVLLATLLKAAQAPKALLVRYKGRPVRFGLKRWKQEDHAVTHHALPEELPEGLTENQAAFAAFEVLWRRGTALHYRDIAAQAAGTSSAKAIKAILYSQRFTHIFTKVDEGIFGLRTWPTEAPPRSAIEEATP